ncbi:CatB-related O-acetyltransferase [Vibrio coralliilyticus]|uniref:CatB-related O-acetyltransferase n=1 Tax=Vibrio coralliilyticus TaxID=190893 RepID=UPI0015619AE6
MSDARIKIDPSTYGCRKDTFRLFRSDDYIEIGKYCSIADKVTILASGEHYIDKVSTYPFHDRYPDPSDYKDTKTKGNVIIANDVWLGYSSTILSGVKIGNGAVIAAGSVVVSDVPDYAVVAGIPARVIKYRFPPNIIDNLLTIEWWNWKPEKIQMNKNDFYLTVDEFISKYLNEEENNVI